MGYKAHNFQAGHKLTALELNEMDNQIAASEASIDQHAETIAGIPQYMRRRLSALSLETDEENAYLYDGEILLSEVPLQNLSSGLVACTGLSISEAGPINTFAGAAAVSVTAERQPNNCTQAVRYSSSDPAVATVSGAGEITPVAVGKANILAKCGPYQQSIQVQVGQKVTPTAAQMHLTGRAMAIIQNNRMNVDEAGTSDKTFITLFTDAGILLPPGYTAQVRLANQTLRINTFAFLTPMEGGFSYSGDDPRPEAVGTKWLRISNCTCDADAKSIKETASGPKYTSDFLAGEGADYTNEGTADCYMVLSLETNDVNGSAVTARQATSADISAALQNLTIVIMPPAAS